MTSKSRVPEGNIAICVGVISLYFMPLCLWPGLNVSAVNEITSENDLVMTTVTELEVL